MLFTFVGAFLLFAPLCLIIKFKDKIYGFAVLLSFIIATQLLIAIISQYIHLFYYPFILAVNILITAVVFYQFYTSRSLQVIKSTSLSKLIHAIDWTLVSIIVISTLCLYAVHFNYSGYYSNFLQPYNQTEKMRYAYPYYADEWYAAAFIKYAIINHNLPFNNPLLSSKQEILLRKPFVNLEFVFHSFLAEIFLLIHLDPLLYYTLITVFINTLIIILIYLFLKFNQVNNILAGIIAASTLFISNGANLPSIWTLIPITMGILTTIISLFFYAGKKIQLILLFIFLTILFYPPLFCFHFFALFFYLYFNYKNVNQKASTIFAFLFLLTGISAFIISSAFFDLNGFSGMYVFLRSKIFYHSLTDNAIPKYTIYNILPVPIILFFIIGFWSMRKKYLYITVMTAVGLFYWFIYSFINKRFIIEYQRVVYFTAILIIIMSGFGAQYLFEYLHKIKYAHKRKFILICKMILLFLSFILMINYTKFNHWEKIIAKDINTGDVYYAAAPANQYLTDEDLQIFQDIKGKIFLSNPWKGTVIGIATNNYPLITKGGTISNMSHFYPIFMSADCAKKKYFAEMFNVDYVYSQPFTCPNFILHAASHENFYLYEVLH